MKKIICALSALALLFTACEKPNNNGNNGTPSGTGEDYLETTLQCSIDLMEGAETNDYGTGTMVMPGDEILKFFDMTADEFYQAMGTYTGSAPNTTQVDNTITFGVCADNNTENLKFVPSSTNNFGCWLDANATPTTWGDDAVFYHESQCKWGLEEPTEADLASMWTFVVGFFPGHNEYKAGDKVKATYFFQKDAETAGEKDLYCYVEMIINVVGAQKVAAVDESKMQDVTVNVELAVTPQTDGEGNVYYAASFDCSEQLFAAFQVPEGKVALAASLGQFSAVRYVGETEVDQTATGVAGNWFDAKGNACLWGATEEVTVPAETEGEEDTVTEVPIRGYYIELRDDLKAYAGIDNAKAEELDGQTISSYKQVITFEAASGKKATATINYKISFNFAE